MHNHQFVNQMKIVTLSGFLLLVILGGYFAFDYQVQRQQTEQSLQQLLDSVTARLASQLANPLWSINEEQISIILKSELGNPDLGSLRILGAEGKQVLFEQSRGAGETTAATDDAQPMELSKPIQASSGETIGYIQARIHAPRIEALESSRLNRLLLHLGGLYTALILSMLGLMKLLFQLPIQRTIAAFRALEQGQLERPIDRNSGGACQELLFSAEQLRLQLKGMRHGG